MLLVQHPQHIPMSPSLMPIRFNSHIHRRNPSAPAAVVHVQATKVPGLLSLSRPQQQPRTTRQATPRQPKTKPAPAPASPDFKQQQQQRGRGSPAKDKATRSSSKPRAGHGRRAHQPSPQPLPSPEQVSSPFSASFPSVTPATDDTVTPKVPFATLPKASTPSPVLSSPSGRLAKRRNRGVIPFPQIDSSPSPANKSKQSPSPSPMPAAKPNKPVSAPMAVPQAKKQSHGSEPHPISRSDPVRSSVFPRVAHRRAKHGVLPADQLLFPVCDDSDSDRPSTPSPLRVLKRDGKGSSSMPAILDHSTTSTSDAEELNLIGSLTAPPSTVRRTFATSTPSPSLAGGVRRPFGHKRAPSYPADSMFGLPFESDSELTSNMSLDFKKFDADSSGLFGNVSGGIRRPRLQSASRAASTPNGKLMGGAFAYASSSFQNSPDPEQLPPPSFQFAVAPLAT